MGKFTDRFSGKKNVALIGKVRKFKVGSLPPFDSNGSAGDYVRGLVEAMIHQLAKQGRFLSAEQQAKINPFEAEPMAQALMMATAEEFDSIRELVENATAETLRQLDAELDKRDERIAELESQVKLHDGPTLQQLADRIEELEGQVEENSMAIGGPEITPADDQGGLPGVDD